MDAVPTPLESRVLLRALEGVPVAMFVADLDGGVRYANAAACALLGYRLDELLGRALGDVFIDACDGARDRPALDQIGGAGQEGLRRLARCRCKAGGTVFGEVRLTVIRDHANKPIGLTAAIVDIPTAQTDPTPEGGRLDGARAAQRASEERLARVIAGARDGLWEWDLRPSGGVWWSSRLFQMLGYEPDAFEPTPDRFFGLMHPDDRTDLEGALAAFVDAPAPFESAYRLRDRSGAYRWIEARGVVLRAPDGTPTHMSGTARDVTEARQREASIRQSEERLRSLAANIPGMIYQFEVSPAGTWSFPYLSEGVRHVFGVEPDVEDAGQRLFELVHPEDQSHVAAAVTRSLEDEAPYELTHRVLKAGGEVRWVRVRSTPRRRPDGSTYWIGLIIDVTDRVRLEEQLRQAQKMEAVGNLAGGIAHDFNNILSGVLGYAEIARDDAAAVPEVRILVEQIIKAGQRARDLVSQILTVSRRTRTQHYPIRLQSVVEEVSKLIRSTVPVSIRVDVRIEETPLVLADASQIHQVLLNLCTNAYQALNDVAGDRGPTGELAISLRRRRVDAASDIEPGEYVELRVDDTGPGIPASVLERIFEPYFTTRQKSQGTGLGLAMVQGIVAAHGGRVDVVSRPGEGASFIVLLPAHDGASEPMQPTPRRYEGSGQRVLIVDDETQIRDVFSRSLARMGFAVEVFSDADDVLRRVLPSPEDVDVVVTDLSMPQMSGIELARRLREIRADLPVILCSGFGDEATRMRALELGIKAFLRKPVSARELAGQILDALENA